MDELNGELDRMPDHLSNQELDEDPPNRLIQIFAVFIIAILTFGVIQGIEVPGF